MINDKLVELEEQEAQAPLSKAPIALIVSPQGGGKSTIMTARAVDSTFANATSVIMPNGFEVPCLPALNDKSKPIIGSVIPLFKGEEPFVAEVPDDACVVAESIKIFANYHLYGIRSYFVSLADIVENINTDLFTNAYLYLDEGYIGADARNSMNMLNQILSTQFAFQLRKRHLHFTIAYPLSRMADIRYRLMWTERIECEYNDKTFEITAKIRKNGKEKKITFDASLYWQYFNTDERFKIPESKISKALSSAY